MCFFLKIVYCKKKKKIENLKTQKILKKKKWNLSIKIHQWMNFFLRMRQVFFFSETTLIFFYIRLAKMIKIRNFFYIFQRQKSWFAISIVTSSETMKVVPFNRSINSFHDVRYCFRWIFFLYIWLYVRLHFISYIVVGIMYSLFLIVHPVLLYTQHREIS